MDTAFRSLHALEFFDVLNYLAGFTVSEAGFQACLSLRPLSSLDEIRKETQLFEEGRLWLIKHGNLLVPFPPIQDIWEAKDSASFTLEKLWALRHTLELAIRVRESFIDDNKSSWVSWQCRVEEMPLPSSSTSALARCLNDEGRIKDNASPELSLIRSELRGMHRQCTTRVKEYATQYNILHFLQDDFMTLSSDRYVLPLKSNFKGRLQGVVHDYSQTGETCYFEPMFLVEVNNKIQSLKREEREEERKILVYLSSLIRDEMPAIQEMYSFLVDLDILNAKASLAECYNGKLIHIDSNERVNLREAAHPLLSLANSDAGLKALLRAKQHLFKQENAVLDGKDRSILEESTPEKNKYIKTSTVSSTLELKDGQYALIISGGNAGGKTVCLKTLGLIALMSRCVIPCPVQAESTLPFWRNVHAFIGDEQSLEDHVSTFTGQISHLANIWENLSSDDIIILDEFGAGTDPSQGAALAQAVISCIIDRGAFAIVATHFPALKAYALSTRGVRSASVLFDPKTKKPLFKLVYEQVGASQALDVAREHGLPEEIITRAEQYLLLTGEDTSSLVERLNLLAVEREKELEVLAKKNISLDDKRKKLEEKYTKDRQNLFEKVQSDIHHVMGEWKKNRISHKQALKKLGEVKKEIDGDIQKQDSVPLDIDSLTIGDTVKHIAWGRVGQLQEIDSRKKRVRLSMDGVTLWAKIEDIFLPEKSQEKASSYLLQKSSLPTTSNIFYSMQLDLRGKRADIAIAELEKFLDTSLLQGRYEVEIIHGRGTGVLRRELHSFLKKFPSVAKFRLAPEDMGGDGMTIVELK